MRLGAPKRVQSSRFEPHKRLKVRATRETRFVHTLRELRADSSRRVATSGRGVPASGAGPRRHRRCPAHPTIRGSAPDPGSSLVGAPCPAPLLAGARCAPTAIRRSERERNSRNAPYSGPTPSAPECSGRVDSMSSMKMHILNAMLQRTAHLTVTVTSFLVDSLPSLAIATNV